MEMSELSVNHKAKTLLAKIQSVKELALNVNSYVVEIAPGVEFNFSAGQLALIRKEGKSSGIGRAYSIATSPQELPRLEFCIRLYPDGRVSSYLKGVKPGDSLLLQAPFGRFVLPTSVTTHQPYIFVATGTGIAPIRSMIRHLLASGTVHPLMLIHGTRSESNLYYRAEFDELANKNKITYLKTLSQADTSWTGATGYVTELMSANLDQSAHYFLCGNPEMVRDAALLLTETGIKAVTIEKW